MAINSLISPLAAGLIALSPGPKTAVTPAPAPMIKQAEQTLIMKQPVQEDVLQVTANASAGTEFVEGIEAVNAIFSQVANEVIKQLMIEMAKGAAIGGAAGLGVAAGANHLLNKHEEAKAKKAAEMKTTDNNVE